MSALLPKADIRQRGLDVRFVPTWLPVSLLSGRLALLLLWEQKSEFSAQLPVW